MDYVLQWIFQHEPVLSYGNLSVAGKLSVTAAVYYWRDEEEEDCHIDSKVHCEAAHSLCGTLSRQGLTQLS